MSPCVFTPLLQPQPPPACSVAGDTGPERLRMLPIPQDRGGAVIHPTSEHRARPWEAKVKQPYGDGFRFPNPDHLPLLLHHCLCCSIPRCRRPHFIHLENSIPFKHLARNQLLCEDCHLSSGRSNRIPEASWLKQQTVPHSSGGQKSEVRVPSWAKS